MMTYLDKKLLPKIASKSGYSLVHIMAIKRRHGWFGLFHILRRNYICLRELAIHSRWCYNDLQEGWDEVWTLWYQNLLAGHDNKEPTFEDYVKKLRNEVPENVYARIIQRI